jgi:hypothetical protein
LEPIRHLTEHHRSARWRQHERAPPIGHGDRDSGAGARRFAGVRVHDGFQPALDNVWNGILPALESLPGPMFYPGHSLGDARGSRADKLR